MRLYLTAVIAGFSLLAGPNASAQTKPPNEEMYRLLDLFGKVLERVRANYPEKLDDEVLIEGAIRGLLSAVDARSRYFSAKEFARAKSANNSAEHSIGVEITRYEGLPRIVTPIRGFPAEKAGLLAGDLIFEIDGKPTRGMTLDRVTDLLTGTKGSQVIVRVWRTGVKDPLQFKMKLEPIVVSAKDTWTAWTDRDIGYVRLNFVSDESGKALESIFKFFRKKSNPALKGYVLDLRNTSGGVLDQIIEIADAFLDRGEILSTRGRVLADMKRWSAKKGDLADGKPMIALVNGGTGGTALIAGALQDHKRAELVGTVTSDYGTVQTTVPLQGGRAFNLTTGFMYTPAGRKIEGIGIKPDKIVENPLPPGSARVEGATQAYVPAELEKDLQYQFAVTTIRAKN